MRKVKIGTAGVDSGQLMVTDPCYFEDFKTKKQKRFYSMERTFLTTKKLFLNTIKP